MILDDQKLYAIYGLDGTTISLTQRAKHVLNLAHEEAARLQHNYIGTEHLLLGLIREEDGVDGRVLRSLGLEQQPVEALVGRMTRISALASTTPPLLSPGTKRVLGLAVEQAREMGHRDITAEHLLLSLACLTEGVAIEILNRLGISPKEVRRQALRVLKEMPGRNPQPGQEE